MAEDRPRLIVSLPLPIFNNCINNTIEMNTTVRQNEEESGQVLEERPESAASTSGVAASTSGVAPSTCGVAASTSDVVTSTSDVAAFTGGVAASSSPALPDQIVLVEDEEDIKPIIKCIVVYSDISDEEEEALNLKINEATRAAARNSGVMPKEAHTVSTQTGSLERKQRQSIASNDTSASGENAEAIDQLIRSLAVVFTRVAERMEQPVQAQSSSRGECAPQPALPVPRACFCGNQPQFNTYQPRPPVNVRTANQSTLDTQTSYPGYFYVPDFVYSPEPNGAQSGPFNGNVFQSPRLPNIIQQPQVLGNKQNVGQWYSNTPQSQYANLQNQELVSTATQQVAQTIPYGHQLPPSPWTLLRAPMTPPLGIPPSQAAARAPRSMSMAWMPGSALVPDADINRQHQQQLLQEQRQFQQENQQQFMQEQQMQQQQMQQQFMQEKQNQEQQMQQLQIQQQQMQKQHEITHHLILHQLQRLRELQDQVQNYNQAPNRDQQPSPPIPADASVQQLEPRPLSAGTLNRFRSMSVMYQPGGASEVDISRRTCEFCRRTWKTRGGMKIHQNKCRRVNNNNT